MADTKKLHKAEHSHINGEGSLAVNTRGKEHMEEAEHKQHHDHSHSHNVALLTYGLGLLIYLVALLTPIGAVTKNVFYAVTILLSGYHVIWEGIIETIAESKEHHSLRPNVHILMTVATIGACIIGDFNEGALLILIFAGAHFLEEYAEGKSKREIKGLLALNPTKARLVAEDGSVSTVAVSALKTGDTLKVLPGDQVPTDGKILNGHAVLNESAITGESMPVEKSSGDIVFGGTINQKVAFSMIVTKDSSETVLSKVLHLVEESQKNLPKAATKIKKLEPTYVLTVLALVPLFIVLAPYIMGWTYYESFYRGMVFLTVLSPCALAASVVPATLSGISNLARHGVLFKGGTYLNNLADIKVVAFDKTGTLTKGEPEVTDSFFLPFKDHSEELMINVLVQMEQSANHPLADAILNHFSPSNQFELSVSTELGKGLTAVYNDHTYTIGKPSNHSELPESLRAKVTQFSQEGKTVVVFGIDGTPVGVIAMMDLPNKNAKAAIKHLKDSGVHTVMLTGDSTVTGEAIANQLGIDEVIGNILPEDKASIVKDLQKSNGSTAMIGDGVNDAPALVQADIGFAMGDGTDVAIDVADAVIMQNDLRRLSYAVLISKRLKSIVWQNIFFSLAVIALLSVLNVLGKMDIGLGVLAHEGSTLVVILNGLRLLTTPSLKKQASLH